MIERGRRRIAGIAASSEYEDYFKGFNDSLSKLVKLARSCRSKGFDPSPEPEVSIAWDLAERVEKLVGPRKVARRIRALSNRMTRVEMAFKVAEEIVYGKFGHLSERDAADQALRTALAIINEGVTVAPVQGIFDVKLKQNPDGTQYLAVYFAGPMRSAGGTAQALTVVIGDFVRRLLHLGRYKPDEREIRRFIEEVRLYERRGVTLQFHLPDDVLFETLRSLPIEVTGVGTGPEVTTFRDLPRIETNRVRAGAIRVVNDGVVGRATKLARIVRDMNVDGWDWLSGVGTLAAIASTNFREKEIIGRPFLSSSSNRFGLRLRYGRSRNTGLGAIGVHPATMVILDSFLAVGTQLRLGGPGKSAVVTPVDFLEGPLVKMKDGSLAKIKTEAEARKLVKNIDRILFLGDALIAYGEFLFNNRPLLPSSFTSEWWAESLRKIISSKFGKSLERVAKELGMSEDRVRSFIREPHSVTPTLEEDVVVAKKMKIALHPSHTFLWNEITVKELVELREWLLGIRNVDGALIGPQKGAPKRILHTLWLPHRIDGESIVIDREVARVLDECLKLDDPDAEVRGKTPIEAIRLLSGIIIEDVARSFLDARIGRPEKAEMRAMASPAHVLFPAGRAGGDLIKASKAGKVGVDIANMVCPKCKRRSFTSICQICGVKTVVEMQCPRCGTSASEAEVCPICKAKMVPYRNQVVDLEKALAEVSRRLNFLPPALRGVKELESKDKMPESIVKGVLRAKHGLSVSKDGCVRFDATNAPLTHFKPDEIGTPIDKLRDLGYTNDRWKKPLSDGEQICELRVQDVVLPVKCGDRLVSVANFIDDLLSQVYDEAPFYNAKDRGDLVGHLIVGISPHTSCGILGRIIGYTEASVCYAHPFWHAAKRRDCDGDEDSTMLALDVLINFSRHYLPDRIGGLMDAPLLLTPIVDPSEVDEEAFNMEVVSRLPLSLYEASLGSPDSRRTAEMVRVAATKIGRKQQYEKFFYTMETSDIAQGGLESAYKKLETMAGKLEAQLRLADRLRAVDVRDVARRILTAHFLKDIVGNLRRFTSQTFRCRACNAKFRRAPLNGKCPRCGSPKVSKTVFQGGIEKYFRMATNIVQKYDLEPFYRDQLAMVGGEIELLFGKRREQAKLTEYT